MMRMRVARTRPCGAVTARACGPRVVRHLVGRLPRQREERARASRIAAAMSYPGVTKEGPVICTEPDGRRLQVNVAEAGLDTLTIRCLDWDRDRFDIEFGLQNGTTYNSYLIFGEEKTALVDSSHEKFREHFMPVLVEELKARGRKVDYLIVSHTEPDHSGLTPDVVATWPDCEVIGSKVCIAFLDGLTHVSMKTRVVKGGDTVDLGGGHVVEFTIAPNLHWPDTMFSYDRASQIMFTCDAFGMHYCSDDPYDTDLSLLDDHYRFYYDCLMKPNARSVTTALRKVKDMPFKMVANGHGMLGTSAILAPPESLTRTHSHGSQLCGSHLYCHVLDNLQARS